MTTELTIERVVPGEGAIAGFLRRERIEEIVDAREIKQPARELAS